jgi:hypothetical protein
MTVTEILSIAEQLCPNRVKHNPKISLNEITVLSLDGDSRVRLELKSREWVAVREEKTRDGYWDESSSELFETLDDVREICMNLSEDE